MGTPLLRDSSALTCSSKRLGWEGPWLYDDVISLLCSSEGGCGCLTGKNMWLQHEDYKVRLIDLYIFTYSMKTYTTIETFHHGLLINSTYKLHSKTNLNGRVIHSPSVVMATSTWPSIRLDTQQIPHTNCPAMGLYICMLHICMDRWGLPVLHKGVCNYQMLHLRIVCATFKHWPHCVRKHQRVQQYFYTLW